MSTAHNADGRTKDGEEEVPHTVREADGDAPASRLEMSTSNPHGAPHSSSPHGMDGADALCKEYAFDEDKLHDLFETRTMDQLAEAIGSVDHFLAAVKSDARNGIDSSTVEKRRAEHGENVLDRKPPVTFLECLADAMSDRVLQILTAASIISIIFGLTLPNPYTGEVDREVGWIEGTAIIISVLVVALIGSLQNYNKAKKFEEIEKEQAQRSCSVIRDGQTITVDSSEMVVGDVLVLETGMEMTCDAFLIRGEDVRINEAPITGEPDLIEKTIEKNVFIVSGTCIEEGTGTVLVAAVGMNSLRGRLMARMKEESKPTPLEEHLEYIGESIGKLGLLLAVLMVIALSIKEVIYITTKDKKATAAAFLAYVIIAITLIAVAIPEGLPLAVTISLAYAMRAMMEQQCMVRILASCETMGAATAICSDKTGTLTTNEMTVVQALIAEHEFLIDKFGVKPRTTEVNVYDREQLKSAIENAVRSEIIEHHVAFPLSCNSTARRSQNDRGEMAWVGNKTEVGILAFLERIGHDYSTSRSAMHDLEHKQFPFSSMKKRMTTIIRREGHLVAYIKGASEAILEQCDRYLSADGKEVDLNDAKREEYEQIIVNMAKQGNRTIGFGYHVTSMKSLPEDEPEDMHFVFVGVVGIQDPVRMEVPDAVANCHSAHLSVRMVTGDNINTAIAISKKCGIFIEEEGHIAMTGPDFRAMYRDDRAKLSEMLPNLRVLARSSPNDKYVLVSMLQEEHGEVVGVTGDGTNDAPALKLANVGFAMNSGTDIAKGAAAMILLDDNFATVVTAIKWGRSVNDNIKKFIQYQLAINFAGVGLTIIGSLASDTSKEPIAPVQLLWLNLIMDTLAALSLATERPEMACLERLPVFKQAPIITNRMRAFIFIHGGYQLLLVLLVLFMGHNWFDTKESQASCVKVGGVYKPATGRCQQGHVHSTMLFNMFIWFQIFNVVNARKIYGELNCFEGIFERSRIMVGVFVVVIALQVIAVEVGGEALDTTGLPWDKWLICVAFGASEILLGFIVRLLPIHDYVPTKEERVNAARKELKEKEEAEKEKQKKLIEAESDAIPEQK